MLKRVFILHLLALVLIGCAGSNENSDTKTLTGYWVGFLDDAGNPVLLSGTSMTSYNFIENDHCYTEAIFPIKQTNNQIIIDTNGNSIEFNITQNDGQYFFEQIPVTEVSPATNSRLSDILNNLCTDPSVNENLVVEFGIDQLITSFNTPGNSKFELSVFVVFDLDNSASNTEGDIAVSFSIFQYLHTAPMALDLNKVIPTVSVAPAPDENNAGLLAIGEHKIEGDTITIWVDTKYHPALRTITPATPATVHTYVKTFNSEGNLQSSVDDHLPNNVDDAWTYSTGIDLSPYADEVGDQEFNNEDLLGDSKNGLDITYISVSIETI